MLMEQEAPLLFHTVFAGAVILTVAYLLHWRGHSPQKKPLELILYFVILSNRDTSQQNTSKTGINAP